MAQCQKCRQELRKEPNFVEAAAVKLSRWLLRLQLVPVAAES